MSKLVLLSVLLFATCACSCDGLGRGGTGELVVPEATLREAQPIDLGAYASTQPATGISPSPGTPGEGRGGGITGTTAPATQPAELSLRIEDVRRIALENNLDLKVELLNPTISKEGISEEEARFEALFTTQIDYAHLNDPASTLLTGSKTTQFQVTPGVQIPLRTGGTITLSTPVDRVETDNSFATLNPAYTTSAAISISQPLLRGGGIYANTQRIRVAFYQDQATQARTKLQVIRVLADAERVYWRLYATRQELLVRKQEYDLAVAQLERAKRQAKAGVAAEVDIVRAESGVADRVEAIITAENAVRNAERDLKRTLNQPGLEMDSPTIITIGTQPAPVPYNLDARRLADQALAGRMEMLEQELLIAQQTSAITVARNDSLPLVSIAYTYNVNGLGTTLDDSFTMLRRKDFEDHRVSLQVEIPLGNEAARSRLRRAIAQRAQQLATRNQRSAAIRQEVYNAVDQLQANWQRLIAARERVRLAARVLDVEIRQFDLGLRTSTDVLDAQTRLGNARSAEIAAITEYEIAQIDIAFATGSLLGASRVAWTPAAATQDR